MKHLDVHVRDCASLRALRPVTGGVPLAEGAAPRGCEFALLDDRGGLVPLQTSVLARWKDGSARWVLLDFQADPPESGAARFRLVWDGNRAKPELEEPVQVARRKTLGLSVGDMVLRVVPEEGLCLQGPTEVNMRMVLQTAQGELCAGRVEFATIETAGPVRGTLAVSGSFRTRRGKRLFGFRIRASVYAGLPMARIEPMILMDAEEGVVQQSRELQMEFLSSEEAEEVILGGKPLWHSQPGTAAPVRLFQADDENYRIEGVDGKGSKAPGWAEFRNVDGEVTVALSHFWEQWPKSIETDPTGVRFGLFPRFEKGAFDAMGPWYKHEYLFKGDCYRLRTGQTRRWDFWVDYDLDGDWLAAHANAPLIPAADPEQAIATGAWGDIAPAGVPAMEKYDAWADNLFEAYCASIRSQRDYGAMNWGDWWGERNCNWGNHEYDTANQVLIQFARTGDPKYFYVGDACARHSSEVDVVHFLNKDLIAYFDRHFPSPNWPARPGLVHEHCVGHVGGFDSIARIRSLFVSLGIGKTKKPYLCLDPYNLGHIWTQGLARHYFLTGDPWTRETLERIGDNLAQLVEDREYEFEGHSHSGRVTGWSMLALAGRYELDFSNRYLRAMRTLANDALRDQDPYCGGWLYELPWGHCFCRTRKHVGEAGFITCIRVNGLSRYWQLTGDKRIPEAVRRAVAHHNNDMWRDDWSDWRYTSCPASQRMNQSGVIVTALVNSVRLTGDEEQLRILRKAWDAKFRRLLEASPKTLGSGKVYSQTVYGCAEAVALLAEREQTDQRPKGRKGAAK